MFKRIEFSEFVSYLGESRILYAFENITINTRTEADLIILENGTRLAISIYDGGEYSWILYWIQR